MPLPACPKTPNCVSSQSNASKNRVEPLDVEAIVPGGDARAALLRFVDWVEGKSRVSIQSQTADTVHAVFVTSLFRFRDDVHVETGEVDGRPVLHIRSASRIGYGDLGANRRRVEWIRGELTAPSDG